MQRLDNILRSYDFVPPVEVFPFPQAGVNNMLYGIHTGNGSYIWKIYQCPGSDDLPSIRYEHAVLNTLARSNVSFCVPIPIPDQDGETLHHSLHGWSVIFPWFPGRRLNPSDIDEVPLLGDTIGQLHTALQHHPIELRPGRQMFAIFFDFPRPKHDPFTLTSRQLRIADEPRSRNLLEWWCEEAKYLHEFVQTTYQTLPWQVCHNDVSPNNVLVEDGYVSAVLDFEFATPATRALDVAMGLRMTMRVWENQEPWKVIQAFFRGYACWIHLSEQEIQALPTLIRLRNVMALLWRLGRDLEHERILTQIEYQQNYVRWLAQYKSQFLDVLHANI
jgi:homoserine kinase type II